MASCAPNSSPPSNGNNSRNGDNESSPKGRKNPDIFSKQLIVMVGLPARGKTYISKKLCRYLTWIGARCKTFNAGEYRRRETGDQSSHHEFFKPSNTEAMIIRKRIAEKCLSDALDFLSSGEGDVAIFDATNITLERRQTIYEQTVNKHKFLCLFIESLCDDERIIKSNITEVKVHGPDYANVEDKEVAVRDFLQRLDHYKEQYVEMCEEQEGHLSYIKVINAGEKLVINRHQGNLQSKVGYWLMNLHVTPRTIYLTRHGESMFNVSGKIGGDSNLSLRGEEYARRLGKKINSMNIDNIRVWTSELKRTIATAQHINAPSVRWKALNEIDAGDCEELTYAEIEERYPEDFAKRNQDKLGFRYKNGESYKDLVNRLEPVIMEMEREGDMVVVGHQAVLRCILSYFMDTTQQELPYVKVPLHTLIIIRPMASGCNIEKVPLGVEAVDTHVPKVE